MGGDRRRRFLNVWSLILCQVDNHLLLLLTTYNILTNHISSCWYREAHFLLVHSCAGVFLSSFTFYTSVHLHNIPFHRRRMAFAGKYFKLKRNDHFQESEDVDLEDNASDTTKASLTAEYFDKTELLSIRNDSDISASSFIIRLRERAKMSSDFWTWLRWGVIVGLQTIMIVLICLKQSGNTGSRNDLQGLAAGGQFVETGGDINGLYKTREYLSIRNHRMGSSELTHHIVSHTYTYLKPEVDKFIPNMTSNDNRMEIRRNWDLLMPRTQPLPCCR